MNPRYPWLVIYFKLIWWLRQLITRGARVQFLSATFRTALSTPLHPYPTSSMFYSSLNIPSEWFVLQGPRDPLADKHSSGGVNKSILRPRDTPYSADSGIEKTRTRGGWIVLSWTLQTSKLHVEHLYNWPHFFLFTSIFLQR